MKVVPTDWTTNLFALLLLSITLLAGCDDSSDSRLIPPSYPNDDVLGLNHVQVMGTHNSYRPHLVKEPMATVIREQFPFIPQLLGDYRHKPLYTQLDELGVRQLALDVNADPEGGNFSERPLLALIGADIATGIPELDLPGLKVFHSPQLDPESTCLLFTDCLVEVKRWSDEHPGHVPIFIMIEIKDIDLEVLITGGQPNAISEWKAEDYDRLDVEIRSVFGPEQLITPDDVRSGHETLENAILADGWPALAKTRGKIMFVMCNCFGNDRRRIDYGRGQENLEGRVLFPTSEPGNTDAAVIRREQALVQLEEIQTLVAQGYIVRTRADAETREAINSDPTRRDAAFASGAQLISTDFPEPAEWIGTDYFVQIPQGTPAGCNPVVAPEFCTPSDIENPEHLLTPTN